jgi:hypothetical protein
MATVTETYILEQDEGKTEFPTSDRARFETAKTNGAIVSNTKTAIIDPSQVVAGKTRYQVTRVWRSDQDRLDYNAECRADAALQTYLTNSNTTKLNRVIS